MAKKDFNINVSPDMWFYTVLQGHSYKLENALTEFVDNSLQSYLDNKERLKLDKLEVTIHFDAKNKTITIEDNAAGISSDQIEQAMKTGYGQGHDDESLSVYGIGMKSAAIWFSNEWNIKTSALGVDETLFTEFNLNELLKNKKDEIIVKSRSAPAAEHGTKITLLNTSKLEDVDYCRNIVLPELLERYFKFDFLKIQVYYNDKKLVNDAVFLKPASPPLKYPEVDKNGDIVGGHEVTWIKEIRISTPSFSAEGFVMILETGSYHQPGIRLLRNKRVIKGTTLRPYMPFVTKNKFAAQRIYGELEVAGLKVFQTKTDFSDSLTELQKEIEKKLKESPDYIAQASDFRKRKVKPKGPPAAKKIKLLRRRKGSNKITFNNDLYEALEQLNTEKLILLYESLCELPLKENPIIAYVATWAFLEVLAKNIGKTGNPGVAPKIKGTFNTYANQILSSNQKQRELIKNIIAKISNDGNANKHHGSWYNVEGQQLAVDFEAISPFLADCIEDFLSKP